MSLRRSKSSRGPREVTGRMVFICLVVFFAVVAGVNAVMVRAAVSTFGGVETESSYQAGLAFAREVAAVDAQDALHWRVTAKVSPEAESMRVEVFANDAADRPLARLRATATLVHPTDKRSDHVMLLDQSAPGKFEGRSERVSGQWTLVIELSRDGTRMFRSKNRVFLR